MKGTGFRGATGHANVKHRCSTTSKLALCELEVPQLSLRPALGGYPPSSKSPKIQGKSYSSQAFKNECLAVFWTWQLEFFQICQGLSLLRSGSIVVKCFHNLCTSRNNNTTHNKVGQVNADFIFGNFINRIESNICEHFKCVVPHKDIMSADIQVADTWCVGEIRCISTFNAPE